MTSVYETSTADLTDIANLTSVDELRFRNAWSRIQQAAHTNSRDKGFYTDDAGKPIHRRNEGEMVALMHSELSEALEAMRTVVMSTEGPQPIQSIKIPGYIAVEEELADLVIRVMDFAEYNGLRVAEAVIAKHKYNRTRPYKHGKKF